MNLWGCLSQLVGWKEHVLRTAENGDVVWMDKEGKATGRPPYLFSFSGAEKTLSTRIHIPFHRTESISGFRDYIF